MDDLELAAADVVDTGDCWIVRKVLPPRWPLTPDGLVRVMVPVEDVAGVTPPQARLIAAQYLAAADEADARARL